jgi:translation initiation factor IF-1
MITFRKIVGGVSNGLVFCLSLSTVTHAGETPKSDPCAEGISSQSNLAQSNLAQCGREARQHIHTITGEILRINGANLIVKQTDGKEIMFHIDLSTQTNGQISPGDRIEAEVNAVEEDEKHVLSIHQIK